MRDIVSTGIHGGAAPAPDRLPATFETLERRLLLSGTPPAFATPIPDAFVVTPAGGALTIGIDGMDADGDNLKITAASDNGNLAATVNTDTTFARLHFVSADGVTPIAGAGDIVVQLFLGRSPTAAGRFITLATNAVGDDGTLDPNGTPFYTDVLVHRVVDYFMVQTGDKLNGDGTGESPLSDFAGELTNGLSFAGRGVLAFANAGAGTNNCQFFITETPTTWLNGGYPVFGQVISGWDVLDALSRLPTPTGGDRPFDAAYLDGVQIFTSRQDGSVTVTANSGFTGTAHVTITLNDGHGNTVQKVVTISGTALPAVPTITQATTRYDVRPGQQTSFTPTFSGGGGDITSWIITYDGNHGAVVTMNPTTHQITVSLPADYPVAAFQIGIYAQYTSSLAYDNSSPAKKLVTIAAHGYAPTIVVPDPDITVFPGQVEQFTATVIDDYVEPMRVWLETDDAALDSVMDIDPVTHQVTISLPDDFDVGSFEMRIRAEEVTAGGASYLYNTPATGTVTVRATGDRPVIQPIDDRFSSPGRHVQLVMVADDDGPRGLDLGITTVPAGATATVDSATGAVDILVPADFTGLMTVTVSACEQGFDDLAPTTATFRVISCAGYDPQALAYVPATGNSTPMSSFAFEDRLYVAASSGGLRMYDLTDPAHPASLGTYAPTGYVRDVKVARRMVDGVDSVLAFVAASDYSTTNRVYAVNVTNPASAVVLDSLNMDGYPISLCLDGNVLYVPMWDKGLASVDVTDPKDIKLLDKIDLLTSQPTGNLEFYYALAAAAAGDWLYVADAAGFVAVLNAADPANLRYVTYVRFARPWDLAVQGDCLYVADEATGLVALNIASPAKPTQAGKLAVPTGQWMNLAVQGSMLVVGEPTGMTYVGVSTPSSMAVTGRFTDPQSGGRATFHGSDVVLPLQADGLLVADASSLLEATVITRSGTVVLGGGLTATISISGGGIVRATVGDGGGAIGLLEVYYGGTRSSVTIRSSGGPTPVQDVIVYGSLGKLTGTRCQLLGDMTVGGLLGTLAWGDVADNHTIDINADGLAVGTRDAVTVALGRVADADLDTHGLPVKGLTVTEWVDGDDDGSAGSITAPWIGKIMAKGLAGRGAVVPIPGDLACDLVLTGADAKGNTLGSAKVAGQIGGTWDLTAAGAGDVGTVSAKLGTDAGWVLDAPHSTVKSADAGTGTLAGTCTVLTIGKVSTKGDLTADITALGADARKGVSIGSLSAAAARGARVVAAGEISKIMLRESHGSDFLAGVRTELIAPDQRYAEAAGDFADVLGTPPALRGIKLLKISGQKAAAGDPTRFLADSNFSAPVFGAVQLANAAEGDAYGLHVLDDPLSDNPRIKSISYKDTLNPPGSSSWRPGQATPAIGGFCVTEVA